MRGWWQDLTDLVLPAECGGCGTPRTVLCPECRAALSGAAPSRVRPVSEPPGLPVVYAAARYADEVRAALLAHKERGALALAGPLGTALAGAVRAGLGEIWGPGATAPPEVRGPGASVLPGGRGRRHAPTLLVPVPSAREAVRARGHDPARRIALAAAAELRRTGTSARVVAVLRQRRAVADQSGLNSRQRLANLAGALTVAPGGAGLLTGGRIVLVDDLMTTGASLAEAARAVRQAAGQATEAHGDGDECEVYGDEDECELYRDTGECEMCRDDEGEPCQDARVCRGARGSDPRGGRGGAVPYGITAGPDPLAVSPVYAGARWEGSEERKSGAQGRAYWASTGPRMAGTNRAGNEIRAAVVAAPPDSFELNWN